MSDSIKINLKIVKESHKGQSKSSISKLSVSKSSSLKLASKSTTKISGSTLKKFKYIKMEDQVKFKLPKKLYPKKDNKTTTSDVSYTNENQPPANISSTQSSSYKQSLKDEYAINPSSTMSKGKAVNTKNMIDKNVEGYSLTTSPVLNQQNVQKIATNPSVQQSTAQSENKKRINLIKKTTLVQELENMQNPPNEPVSLANKNEQNFELGLVPIDIYTTSDYETAEQIVEARGYVLQQRIGAGAFANVYKAWHVTEQIYTACKVIELKKKKKKRLNDLKHELYVLDKMDHQNIVKMYEHFLVDEKVYIFLEFASCGTLSEYVRKRGPLNEKRARKWFKQIASGLYHMHSQGVSHRDLKLGNILIDEVRNLKITDFGLSRVSYRKGHGIFYCTSYAGTESYMSPQVITKDEFGKRLYDPLAADIWALGVCLYAMVNKAYPFNPDDKELMVSYQMQRKWKFVKKQRNKMSNEIKDMVRNLLEPDPKRRITFLGIATHPWITDQLIELDSKGNATATANLVQNPSISISSSTMESNVSKVNAQNIFNKV